MRQPQRSERRHGFGSGPFAVRADSPGSSTSADRAWIDETVRVRDLHQFEIKLNYPLARDKSVTSYDLECFIFVPHSLGVHGANYSKARFYDDLRAHIRFKTPTVQLTRIADETEGPLANLRNNLLLWQQTSKEGDVGAFEYRTKLFCCVLQSSLRDFVAFIDEVADPDDHDRLVRHFLDATAAITESYRALRRQVFLPSVPSHVRDIHAFGDEYVSLLVERSCYDLLRHVLDGGDDRVDALSRDVMDAIAREVGYRESRQYPSIPRDKSDNEQLIFRRNVLKKYMQNVLFLDTRTRLEGKAIEHGLFGLAAGLSMLFATAVLFISQSIYGPLTMPVFLTLVVGYMFKDRIKEILRVSFSRMMSGVLFDHKTRIYSKPGHTLGICRESFDFVAETKVPERVIKIRARDHITEIESDWLSEDVLRYRKRIRLKSSAIEESYLDVDADGITDIIRFNVAEFTQHMGNPRKELFILSGDGYRKVKAERVYHLNMILRYGTQDNVRYKRLRIVLNRRRIKRIEAVSVEDE